MVILVTCDNIECRFEEKYAMGEDESISSLKKRMETNGWAIIDEDHFCPNCTSGE